jgi:hypothetical protein
MIAISKQLKGAIQNSAVPPTLMKSLMRKNCWRYPDVSPQGGIQNPAKGKVSDWRDDLADFERVSIQLDLLNIWSPFEQFKQIQLQVNAGLRKSTRLEGVVQEC